MTKKPFTTERTAPTGCFAKSTEIPERFISVYSVFSVVDLASAIWRNN